MVNRAFNRKSGGTAQGKTWAVLVLLVLVVLIPAVAVSWLVLKASEDKQMVVEKIYEDARTGFLESGQNAVREEVARTGERFAELVAGVAPEARWARVWSSGEADGYSPADSEMPAAGRAMAVVGDDRPGSPMIDELEAIGDLRRRGDVEEAGERMDALLKRPDLPDARLPDGRMIAPMVAFLATETAGDDEHRETARARLKAMILDEDIRAAMPLTQLVFYLGRIRDWDDDPQVEALNPFVRNSVQWMEHREGASESEGQPAVSRSGSLIGFRPAPASGVFLLEATTLATRVQERLDLLEDRAGGRLVLRESRSTSNGGPPVGEAGTGVIGVEAGFPLQGWLIEFQGDDGITAMGRANREVFWLAFVGAFVIGLSIALSLALFRVMQRQTRLAQLKNDLVATVSHELKTPVASIRLLVDTLQADPEWDPVRVKDYLGLISRENKRLGHLIENFLSFSRMERDKNSFDLRPVDPRMIVTEAETIFRERLVDGDGLFRVECDGSLPLIVADCEALQTALGNLLENAQKYGGRHPDILLTVGRKDGWVEFSVEDKGIGIAKEDQKRIFEKFFQARTRLSEHAGGVGLGLSIVSFIVEKHRGELKLESETGKGSRFTIRIPAGPDEPADASS
ncbi:MAG: HAMP domain-containing sensor histidine kinase [Opitutaceae bacterium]